ncbi:MAG: hypothetical protein AB8H03_03560 [Saprospiraceae bacterium]
MKNKNNHFTFLVLIVALLFVNNIFAQKIIKETHGLAITGKSFGSSVKLRWAPTSMYAWKEANKSGYVLERSTVRRGDKILPLSERKKITRLTNPSLKPLVAAEDWKPLMERNNYAAIAAQALYGKSFTGSVGDNSLKSQKDEQYNRFSFGLFAADQSVEVAEALGLYFEDKTVVEGEYYLYKIYAASAPKEIPIDTGYLYLGTDEVYNLPKVSQIEVEFADRVAYISWNSKMFEQFYTTYQVERSTDGQNFQKINAAPFVGMDRNPNTENDMLMMDSLESNDQLYVYRVRGKTIFEEMGAPSDPVQGMGINPKVNIPTIVSVSNMENISLGIGWDFFRENEKEIVGFQLRRSATDQGVYELLSGESLIDKSLRYFVDQDPLPVNYYRIVAIDKYGRSLASFSALSQLEDETPPAPPTGLRGAIMEDGTMVISWLKNEEPDMMGYRVYMANRKDRAEYAQITSKPVQRNYFTYDVPMHTLSEEVFVKIRALDFRQNASDFSAIVTIVRPDSIPPAAPVFVNARPLDNGVRLIWENSASSDVVNMLLERKKKSETAWVKIKSMTYPNDLNIKSHQDTTVERGVPYEYRLVALDDADLTTSSRIISAAKIDNGIRTAVEKVIAEVDRKRKMVLLKWEYEPDGKDLTHYVIYRAMENNRPRKYKTIQKTMANSEEATWQFTDEKLRMDTEYKYQIRAIYANGAQSPLSQVIEVSY